VADRRQFLSLCGAGTAALLAGCFDGTDGNAPEPGGTSVGPGGSSPGASDASPASPTPEGLLYRNEWNGLTIENGGGEILDLGEIREDGLPELSYSVTARESVEFDVYVFDETSESEKRKYERWINGAPSQPSGIVGLSGATARNVSGSVERNDVSISSGRLWIAVDYSAFDGGTPRAEPDEDGPDEITVDVSVRIVAAF
jgi:hypothetical protein